MDGDNRKSKRRLIKTPDRRHESIVCEYRDINIEHHKTTIRIIDEAEYLPVDIKVNLINDYLDWAGKFGPEFSRFRAMCYLAWWRFTRGNTKTHVFPGFPRCWSLFGFLLPRETRVRVFDPRQQELLEDYTLARRSYRTKWARRWLVFCFTFRTALMVLECFRAMVVDKVFWWVPWIVTAIRWFR